MGHWKSESRVKQHMLYPAFFKSDTDENTDQGTVAEILGAVSKMASAMRNERFQYKLEGTLLNPGDSKNVVLA